MIFDCKFAMKVFVVVLSCLAVGGWLKCAEACQGHDAPCNGDNCCGGMYCQKNDPSWAEGRCYYRPGDEGVSSNSTSFTSSSFPISSCDPSVGQVCLPNACEKARCELMADAQCLADRCGCEARFFKWNDKLKVYQDYSRMCHVSNHFAEVQRFMKEDLQSDEGKAEGKELVELYRTFNSLTVEILLDIGRYLQDVVHSDPSEKNLAKLRQVLNILQALQGPTSRRAIVAEDSAGLPFHDWDRHRHRHHHRHGRPDKVVKKWFRYSEDTQADTEDVLAEKKGKFGKKLLKKFAGGAAEAAGGAAVGAVVNDEEVRARAWLDVLRKGWKMAKELLDDDATSWDSAADEAKTEEGSPYGTIVKVAKKLISDRGKFAEEINSGKVAISDKNVRDKFSTLADSLDPKAISIRVKWTKDTENDQE